MTCFVWSEMVIYANSKVIAGPTHGMLLADCGSGR